MSWIHAAFPPSSSCCKSGACTCHCDPWTRCTRAASRCVPHPCRSCDGCKTVTGTETDRHKSTFLGRPRFTRPAAAFVASPNRTPARTPAAVNPSAASSLSSFALDVTLALSEKKNHHSELALLDHKTPKTPCSSSPSSGTTTTSPWEHRPLQICFLTSSMRHQTLSLSYLKIEGMFFCCSRPAVSPCVLRRAQFMHHFDLPRTVVCLHSAR